VNLRDDIYTALYGPRPIIPITATNDDAARIYKDYCDDGLLPNSNITVTLMGGMLEDIQRGRLGTRAILEPNQRQ
jgi:hypothetical protein